MSFRATIVLGVIAAGLGLYVYLVEVQGERSRQQAETEAKRLLSFEPEQITALELPLENDQGGVVPAQPIETGNDEHLELNRRWADLMTQMARHREAARAWHRVIHLEPDPEKRRAARRELERLSAERNPEQRSDQSTSSSES